MWEIFALFSYSGYDEEFVCLNFKDVLSMTIPKGVLLHVLYRSKNCKFGQNMYVRMTHDETIIDKKSELTMTTFLELRIMPNYARAFYFGGHNYTSKLGIVKGKKYLTIDKLANILKLGGVKQKWKLLMFDVCSFMNKANVIALKGIAEYLIGFESWVGNHGLIITGMKLKNNVFSYFDITDVPKIFQKFNEHKDVIGEANHLHLIKYDEKIPKGYKVLRTITFNEHHHDAKKAIFQIGGGSLAHLSPYVIQDEKS